MAAGGAFSGDGGGMLPPRQMVVGCFPLARCDDGVVAHAEPGCGGLLHHGLCLEEHGAFGFPESLPLSCGGSRRLNG